MINFKMGGVGIVSTAFLLQACAPTTPEYFREVDEIATQAAEDMLVEVQACNSTTLQWMVGQSQTIITAVEITGPVRIIGVDQVITMEYDPLRTNFYLDVAGHITRVTCG
ncbi:MAG: I78 family peptidase inhibitor [Paracoccaceae bacterium]